ncbi:6624_t:CDS:2, partial [Cetraspora pellucida]
NRLQSPSLVQSLDESFTNQLDNLVLDASNKNENEQSKRLGCEGYSIWSNLGFALA